MLEGFVIKFQPRRSQEVRRFAFFLLLLVDRQISEDYFASQKIKLSTEILAIYHCPVVIMPTDGSGNDTLGQTSSWPESESATSLDNLYNAQPGAIVPVKDDMYALSIDTYSVITAQLT